MNSSWWTIFKFWGKLDGLELHVSEIHNNLDIIIFCSASITVLLWNWTHSLYVCLSSCTVTKYQKSTQIVSFFTFMWEEWKDGGGMHVWEKMCYL